MEPEITKQEEMSRVEYDEAMREMECWQVRNHLKDCKECRENLT